MVNECASWTETERHAFMFPDGSKHLGDCSREELLEVIRDLIAEREQAQRQREFVRRLISALRSGGEA